MSKKDNSTKTVHLSNDLHKKIRLRSAKEDIKIKEIVKKYLERGLEND